MQANEIEQLDAALDNLADRLDRRGVPDPVAAQFEQEAALPEGALRGHTFHYSSFETPLAPIARASPRQHGSPGEHIYGLVRLTASYVHLYSPSNPDAAAGLFLP